MKTNKPEVVAEVHQHLNNLVVDWKSPTSDSVCVAGDQLIRLSDYEALATECEKLRSLLVEIKRGCSRRDMPSEQTISSWADAITAVMEGDTSEGS